MYFWLYAFYHLFVISVRLMLCNEAAGADAVKLILRQVELHNQRVGRKNRSAQNPVFKLLFLLPLLTVPHIFCNIVKRGLNDQPAVGIRQAFHCHADKAAGAVLPYALTFVGSLPAFF